MSTVLLIVIYVAFVGLGIPDSIFGSAWPKIYAEFSFPISYANFVTTVLYASTVLSSVFSGKIIKMLGTGWTTAVSTILTAVGLIGFALSSEIVFFCLCAVPLGLGAGAIDAALNHYVAKNYKASHMSFLHCAYGVGVTASPFLMSFALSGSGGWRGGYRMVFYIQAVIAVITILALPLWKKVNKKDENSPQAETVSNPASVVLKKPIFWIGLMVFFGTCALEFTCGVWTCSFLVEARNFSEDTASFCLAFYYMGIALGRFFSGFLNKKITPRQIIVGGEILSLIGVCLTIINGGMAFAIVSLVTIGIGNGPIFPNMTYLTSFNYGEENAQSAIGIQMAASNMAILIVPPIFGFIAQSLSVSFLPFFLLFMHAIMAIFTVVLFIKTKTIFKTPENFNDSK